MALIHNTGFQRMLTRRRDVLLLTGVTALLLFTPFSALILIFLPLASFWVAIRSFQRRETLFASFIVWLLVLTPFLRRVVEYEGHRSATAILAIPFVLLLIPLADQVFRWSRVRGEYSAIYILGALAVLYGAAIAVLHFGAMKALLNLPFWLLPISFGFYLYSEKKHFTRVYRAFENTMIWATIVAGFYGIVQYFFLPSWDRVWMQTAEIVSIGKPEPMEVRVFTTMNAPQLAAAFLLVGILIAFSSRSRWRWLTIFFGFSSLLLSSARSSWVGLAGGVLVLLVRASFSERVRILAIAIGIALTISLAMQVPGLGENLQTRFDSFTSVNNDDSAQERSATFTKTFDSIVESPFGVGLGMETEMSDAEHDSSVIASLISLGLPGTLILLLALAVAGKSIFLGKSKMHRGALLALQTCFAALLVEAPVNNVLEGTTGVLMWSCIGLALAAISSEREVVRIDRAKANASHRPSLQAAHS